MFNDLDILWLAVFSRRLINSFLTFTSPRLNLKSRINLLIRKKSDCFFFSFFPLNLSQFIIKAKSIVKRIYTRKTYAAFIQHFLLICFSRFLIESRKIATSRLKTGRWEAAEIVLECQKRHLSKTLRRDDWKWKTGVHDSDNIIGDC